jgi:hypothetical protein
LLTSALGSSPVEQEEPLSIEGDRRHVSVGNHLTRALLLGRWPRCLIPGFLQGLMAAGQKSRPVSTQSIYSLGASPINGSSIRESPQCGILYTSSRLYYIAWEVYVWSASCPPLAGRLFPSPRHEFLMRYWPGMWPTNRCEAFDRQLDRVRTGFGLFQSP